MPKNVVSLSSRAAECLLTAIRDKSTSQAKFVEYSDRLMRLVVEEGLTYLPDVKMSTVHTPCGPCNGLAYGKLDNLCAVSVVRSGNTLLEAVRQVLPAVSVGHVLVQRDEDDPDKSPIFFYNKFPGDVATRTVLLCDPMLATGGSAKAAIACCLEAGVSQENILFLNVVSAPEGIASVHKEYPDILIVCAKVDEKLNEEKFIVPGLGDFGDRYYNSEAT